MKRGALVTIAMTGDFGKPRPALFIQSDVFHQTGTVTVLLISGTLVDAPLIRTTIEPTPANGLRKRSQFMVDKAMFVKRDKIGGKIGHLDAETMLALAVSFAIASAQFIATTVRPISLLRVWHEGRPGIDRYAFSTGSAISPLPRRAR